jgi:enoyl-CoA hydratase
MAPLTRSEITDGIAWITLDDGKVNALSLELLQEIGAQLDRAEAAKAVAVLRGRPGIFSAGFDLKTFAKGDTAGVRMVTAGGRLVERLLAYPYPVLALCTGHAYPAGAFLMLASDVRIGVEGAFRIGLNETAIGMTVPRFAVELARHRLTPPGFARITTAALFGPEQAMQLGYLDRVLPAAALDAAAFEEAQRLRALDMPSYTATKQRINERAIAAIHAAIEEELVSRAAA